MALLGRERLLVVLILIVATSGSVIPTLSGASNDQTQCVSGTYLQTSPTDEFTEFTFENLTQDEQDVFLRILSLTESVQTAGLLVDADPNVSVGIWGGRIVQYRNSTFEVVEVHVDCPPTATPRIITRTVIRTVVQTPAAPTTNSAGQPGFTVMMAALVIAATLLIGRRMHE